MLQKGVSKDIQEIFLKADQYFSDHIAYTATLDGHFLAMDDQTGETKWITIIAGARFQASPCVITHKGDIYYPGLSGDIQ